MTLHRLIYASRLARSPWERLDDLTGGEPEPDLSRLLQSIVRASIPNNLRVGVDSMLIAHDGWFLQALEGPGASVRSVFERISADDRHTPPVVLREGPIGERAFGRWIMCAHGLSGADTAILSRFGLLAKFDPVREPMCPVLPLLVAVAREHRKMLDFQHEHLTTSLARRAA